MTQENEMIVNPVQAEPENVIGDGASAYVSESVQIFRDAAHIRQRPGMYIGNVASSGLHHLAYELVYNSVDEALAGHCKNIQVRINIDGSLTVRDDGRGIPVDEHPEAKRPTLEVVLTTVGSGAKFDKNTYRVSAGLHGIGAKAVTALSEWVEAEVHRNGRAYVQEYERGNAITGVKEVGVAKGTGTRITFKPDPQIFHEATFSFDTLETRLRELAFLNKGLAIKLTDERTGKEENFKYEGGIAEFVQYLNRSEEPLHKPIYIEKTLEGVRVEVALQYTTSEEERCRCYANNAYNSVGGTHLSGFRAALTRALNTYGNKEGLFKNGLAPIGEDLREGLTAIISVQVPEPQLEAQTKIRLNNPEVEGIVASVVHDQLSTYLEENPKDATKIMKKVILAAEAREAAAKAKKQLKDRKSILSSGGLPGKLMDCTTRDRDESELFLVEGQSAGGSAESGRNRMYQAILPLRGKVLNVEKARPEKVLSNEEIVSLISAVGVDIGNSDDISRLRYGKIVILTDADVDGQHIRTLLLTFFYRQMRKLVEDGYIYVARPPLYKVTQKKNVRYVQTVEEMSDELLTRGISGSKLRLLEAGTAGHGSEAGNGSSSVDLPAPTQDTSLKQVAVGPTPDSSGASVVEGERLVNLLRLLDELEPALAILERRGLSLPSFLAKAGPGGLPLFRVLIGNQEHWLASREEVDALREATQKRLGKELVVAEDASEHARSNGQANGHGETIFEQELHEVVAIKRVLERMKRDFGLDATCLIEAPRLAGREPVPRFVLENGDSRRQLPHLRELVPEIRRLGERGMSITRFKGLGEMDGEELWETTLDPAKRMLMKVQLEDALKTDEMFRVLMGEKVEPRRDFIQKHALEVKDIDYHGA
jgi:DNA gyrase subunit B